MKYGLNNGKVWGATERGQNLHLDRELTNQMLIKYSTVDMGSVKL